MSLHPLSRKLLHTTSTVLLSKIHPIKPSLFQTSPQRTPQRSCTRHLSVTSHDTVTTNNDTVTTSNDTVTRQPDTVSVQYGPWRFFIDQEELFSDPAFFQTPVLMLHCAYTDFAVSFHAPDKLDELDCLWSCFPCDLKIYGMQQRLESKTVQLILVRARQAMQEYGVTKCRVVFKGYNTKTLLPALAFLQSDFPFEFISVTDLTRKIGEESLVYQRPVPRYPHHKLPMMRAMVDGPDVAPKSLIDKFTRLNVKWLDLDTKGEGLRIKSTEAKASKRGFILKKSQVMGKKPLVKNLLAPEETPS